MGALTRGVCVTLIEILPGPAEGVEAHYERAAFTSIDVMRVMPDGSEEPWVCEFRARWDGVGWLVYETTRRSKNVVIYDSEMVTAIEAALQDSLGRENRELPDLEMLAASMPYSRGIEWEIDQKRRRRDLVLIAAKLFRHMLCLIVRPVFDDTPRETPTAVSL